LANAKTSACRYISSAMKVMGTAQTAKLLGVSERRVRELIQLGILKATKLGHDWAIAEEEAVRLKATSRPAGRPKKKINS
jgi:excisionase family DNA binding protein